MLRNLFSIIRFFIFWLLFFVITRLTFELYFFYKIRGASFGEILQTFFYGFRLDASATAYICIIPLLVFIVNWCVPSWHIKPVWLKIYVGIILFCISLNTILNFNIFREWGTKVTFRVFSSVYHAPSEALASSGSSPVGKCILIGVLLLSSGALLSRYVIDYKFRKPAAKPGLKTGLICLLVFVNFLLMRGGLQTEPINQNAAYFSDKEILNQSALNTEWNLFNNIFENFRKPYNPYVFMEPADAEKLVHDSFSTKSDSSLKILTTDRPNVVIIQLESYTASIIESLGGDKGVAPHFEKFIQQGVLFNNIYSSADRTDKGIISIMSGFPSQAIRTVIADTLKQRKLPALSVVFKNEGYHTSYFYGGKSSYMDFNIFMNSHAIDQITDESAFAPAQVQTKWGVYDDVLLSKHLQFAQQQKQPFFSYLQTSTNHEPFVLPVKAHFPADLDGDASNQFRSTAYFADSCLNAYFEQAKKQAWYKNTLFILVADHGHRLPRNIAEAYDPVKYHIPLLFFGDVIRPEYRGKKINKLGGQTDIAATLLSQLSISHNQFTWSKDLLDPGSKDFAFFNWDNGFGFMTPQQSISYDNSGRRIVYKGNKNADEATTDNTLQQGKAFLQLVYTEYMAF